MKSIIILILLFSIFSLFSCHDNGTSSNENEDNIIELYNVELNGCNKIGFLSKISEINNVDTVIYEKDTVIVKTLNDTTTVSVNLNYICAWKFDNNYEIIGDTLYLTITDTCTTNCGAWCYCDYIFDYKFSDLTDKNLIYKAYFESLRNDSKVFQTI